MYTIHKRLMFMVNKDGVPRQHMYYYGSSTSMINKEGFSTIYDLLWLPPSCFLRAKWQKIRLSIPAESKIAEKMLEPADEGS